MDFRDLTLAVTTVLLAFDALDARAPRRFFATALLALATRQEVAVILAALAVARSLQWDESWNIRLRWLAAPLVLCVAWMVVFQLYLIAMFGPEAAALYRQGIRNPTTIAGAPPAPIATTVEREWPAIVKFEVPLVAAGLAAPELTAVGLALHYPPMRMGQWSLNPSDHFARYTVPSTTVLLAAVAVALGRIGSRICGSASTARARWLIVYAAICGLALVASTGFMISETLRVPSRVLPADQKLLAQLARDIAPTDGVMGFVDVLPQFSSRTRIFEYHQLPGFRPSQPFTRADLEWVIAQSDWCLVARTDDRIAQVIAERGEFELFATGDQLTVYRRSQQGNN
jgi:hypothetical protein